jgi:hypothetical protein
VDRLADLLVAIGKSSTRERDHEGLALALGGRLQRDQRGPHGNIAVPEEGEEQVDRRTGLCHVPRDGTFDVGSGARAANPQTSEQHRGGLCPLQRGDRGLAVPALEVRTSRDEQRVLTERIQLEEPLARLHEARPVLHGEQHVGAVEPGVA